MRQSRSKLDRNRRRSLGFESLEPRRYLAAGGDALPLVDAMQGDILDGGVPTVESLATTGVNDTHNGYKSFFWMVGRENMLYSEQMLRHIADRGYSQIVWGPGDSGNVGGSYDELDTHYYPQYEPTEIAARLKQLNPDINVNFYLRHGTHYLAQYMGRRIYDSLSLTGSDYLRNFDEEATLTAEEIMALENNESYNFALLNDETYSFKNGYHFDWSSDDVKDEYVAALQAAYADQEQFQADGFIFDNNIIDPTIANVNLANSFDTYATSGPLTAEELEQKRLDWIANARGLYEGLRDADIPAFFNAITFNQTSSSPAQITIDRYNGRIELLTDDDGMPLQTGASIERFGSAGSSGSLLPLATDANLDKLASLPSQYPEQTFLFHGRAPINHYMDYEDEYQWYRYIYGQYLIGTGAPDNASFAKQRTMNNCHV